jgi:hypothetical protein
MKSSPDLEKSLRKILTQQLRELVGRCAPGMESTDRDAIGSLLEQMISSWVSADPRSRRDVLNAWLAKVGARVAVARTVKNVKAGSPLVSSSRSPYRLPGKLVIEFGPKGKAQIDPSFDILSAKPIPKAQTLLNRAQPKPSATVKSKEIAELLGLSTSYVEGIRQKLRSSGLDVALLGAGWAWEDNKAAGRRPSVSKARSN